MRVLLLAAVVAALAAGSASTRSDATATEPARAAKTLSPVLGISYRSPGGALAWFEPLTFRMLPGRKAPLGKHYGSWAFSQDRRVLAIASCSWEGPTGLRLVNARAMRVLGDIRLSRYEGCAASLTWLRRDRLLAVAWTENRSELVVVNPVARRIVRRERLPVGAVLAIGRTRDELVLLLGASDKIGAARIVVARDTGRVRVVTVDRILAGIAGGSEDSGYRAREVSPGLAVDPDGRRAFLVPAAGPVAEVDLVSLEVSYHQLDRRSLLQRFMSWLTPAAQAKLIDGPVRHARWLGDGVIAVSGIDYSVTTNGQGEHRMSTAPAGVRLIDTQAWKSRTLNTEASGFAVAPGLVIALGGLWESGGERGSGPGVLAFSVDGRERWQLHAGRYLWMDSAGLLGYVYVSESSAEVVDLPTGLVLAKVRWDETHPRPYLLARQVSDW